MEKKIVELVIGDEGIDNLGVDAIALVENPAIEEDFLYFKAEKFVEPRAGEDEGEFIGRCMSDLEGEYPDQDQRLAVCYSYWEGSEEEFDIDTSGLSPYVDQVTGYPLFDTRAEAEAYAEKLGCKGAHQHGDKWMACDSHDMIIKMVDDEKETILEMASTFGFRYDFANAAVIPGFETEAEIINFLQLSSTKGRTLYKYDGPTPQRDFCSQMMGYDRFYVYEELSAMESVAVNPGFGRDGADTYSIWKYKGGPRCKHFWRKYYASLRPNGTLKIENKGKAVGLAGTDPGSMPLEGYVSEESRRRSEIGYIVSQNMSSDDTGCCSNEYHFNDDQRIVTGPAMIPNLEIPRKSPLGEKYFVYFSEETIRNIAEKFMKEKRLDSTNIEHDSDDPRTNNYVYESWIVENPEKDKAAALGFSVPKGTWMVSMRVGDDQTWKLVKEGKIKGFSVEGFFGEMKPVTRDEELFAKLVEILKDIE